MAQTKYLVTVDSETKKPIKVQRMDDQGGATDVDPSELFGTSGNVGSISASSSPESEPAAKPHTNIGAESGPPRGK